MSFKRITARQFALQHTMLHHGSVVHLTLGDLYDKHIACHITHHVTCPTTRHAQHVSLGLLREMCEVLELAERSGPAADRRAADHLQRRCAVRILAGSVFILNNVRSSLATGKGALPAAKVHAAAHL